jgi:hypothetical protein
MTFVIDNDLVLQLAARMDRAADDAMAAARDARAALALAALDSAVPRRQDQLADGYHHTAGVLRVTVQALEANEIDPAALAQATNLDMTEIEVRLAELQQAGTTTPVDVLAELINDAAPTDLAPELVDRSTVDPHVVLGVGQLVPGFGAPAAAADALLYAGEGDYASAAQSAVGIFPFASWVVRGARVAYRAERAIDAGGDVAGEAPAPPAPDGGRERPEGEAGEPVHVITVSREKYPESAQHIEDAQATGKYPSRLTIDRDGAKTRRRESLRGEPTEAGKDRDEYPLAVFEEGGAPEGGDKASVRRIDASDNRGAGASIGNQLRRLDDEDVVEIKVVP